MPEMRKPILIIAYIYYVVSSSDNCPKNLPNSANLLHSVFHCYEFIFTRQATWYQAQDDCMSKKGFLIDVQSSVEAYIVRNYFMKLRETVQVDTGVWIGLKYSPEKNWHWNSSVSKMYYNHWYPGQPQIVNGEWCGLMQIDGRWHNYPCEQKYSWICKYKAVVNDKCPEHLVRNENLRQFYGHCYRFVLKNKMPWFTAYLNCIDSGGKLVDLYNEYDFLFRSWQELRYQDENDTMLWTDDKKIKRRKRSSSGQRNANCFRMNIDGQFGPVYLNECAESHGFICEYNNIE